MAAVVLWCCAAAAAATPLKVVASFSILADMVRAVGGPDIELVTLIAPGAEAHGFEPGPHLVKAVSGADLIVENGLDFEPWLPGLLSASDFSGIRVVASHGVRARPGDPHAWLDSGNGAIYVANIAEALATADPARAADYRGRGRAVRAKLLAQDGRLKAEFAAIPSRDRKCAVIHQAYGYFGDAYGVEFLALTGLSAESEPSAARIARVIDRVRAEGIRALFVEDEGDARLMEQIARETGVRIGGALYSDTLARNGPASTYLGMLDWNARQLLAALRE